MRTEMQLRGFALRTQRTYTNWMRRLVREVRLPADQVTEEQARAFLSRLSGRGLSASMVNQAISAVRFFFGNVLRRSWDLELRYQREPQRVPVTLTPEEVSRLLEAVPNLRDRTAMEIAYATGLRLGEVLQLKVTDIDSGRMMLRVEQGKWKKDRNVMLGPSLLESLRTYWKRYRPKHWLFPGKDPSRPVHPTMIQRAFTLAKHEARIRKPELPFVAPQLCHAAFGFGRECEDDPGASRPSQLGHDPTLYPRGGRLSQADTQPAGLLAGGQAEIGGDGPKGPLTRPGRDLPGTRAAPRATRAGTRSSGPRRNRVSNASSRRTPPGVRPVWT
jgi:integrase/recombinase XerD